MLLPLCHNPDLRLSLGTFHGLVELDVYLLLLPDPRPRVVLDPLKLLLATLEPVVEGRGSDARKPGGCRIIASSCYGPDDTFPDLRVNFVGLPPFLLIPYPPSFEEIDRIASHRIASRLDAVP